MRNALLMVLLAAVSSSAAAEWVVIASSYDAVFYANPATIRRSGDMVTMWDLTDYKKSQLSFQQKQYLSDRSHTEYDCGKNRRRVLYFSFHSGQMGGGEIVYSGATADDWRPNPPGTVAETLSKFACAKRYG